MGKTRQVAKIEANGKKFTIVFREGDKMPYVVYRHTWGLCKSGYGCTEHKRIESYFDDLSAALRDLAFEF